MAIDHYAEKLNMLELTNKTLTVCDDSKSEQYQRLLNSKNDSLLWFIDNMKDIEFFYPQKDDKSVIAIVISGKPYFTDNLALIEKAETIIKERENSENMKRRYVPTAQSIENSIEIENIEQVDAKKVKKESKTCYPIQFEHQKTWSSFLFTENKYLVNKNGQPLGEIKVYLFPLKIYQNKLDPECVLVVESGNYNKKREIILDNAIRNYGNAIIRTTFSEGVLHGVILPDENSVYDFNLISEENHTPDCQEQKTVGSGHICFPNSTTEIIHVFPFSSTNDAKGNASCAILSEQIGSDDPLQIYSGELVTYWQNDMLITDILPNMPQNPSLSVIK